MEKYINTKTFEISWDMPDFIPCDDDIPTPPSPNIDTDKIVTGAVIVGISYAVYLGIKWGIAIAASPVTGGASIGAAAVLP